MEWAYEINPQQESPPGPLDNTPLAPYIYSMSTKVAESCPKCGTAVDPTDKVVVYFKVVPCRTWRYECVCGHVWANDLQRDHNEREYNRMYKAVHNPSSIYN